MIAREGGAFTYRRSTSTLIIVREGGAFTHRRATSTLMKPHVRFR